MRKLSLSILPLFVFLAPFAEKLTHPRTGGAGASVAASREADGAAARRVRARIASAKKALQQSPAPAAETVTVAVEDADGARFHLVTLTKETLLRQGATTDVVSSLGAVLRVTVVRPNYVNTALRVTDAAGRELSPLAVKYPRTEGKQIKEIAYYASAHPALAAPALARDGRGYIREQLAAAASELRARGERIDPSVVAVAERLCVVEHADHKRFMREDSKSLFDEITTLYALNAGDTYRYSVSTAGAGGMIQMIPQTYAAIRAQHPEGALKADFVEGMQDHANATRAMLLYMQDTWDSLARRDQIKQALATNLATQAELLAAGYNSNPMRLASYLEKGGSSWRTLIPAETQMYLQIYAAVDRLVPGDATVDPVNDSAPSSSAVVAASLRAD
ncbi:MAG TPA: hypothetical protein VF538_08285 [Pyrinomonadaceae bacterium]|jgi:hypothetical protein